MKTFVVVSDQIVLLATAFAYLIDGYGSRHRCRILCDPGSQVSFITSSFLNKLAIRRTRLELRVESVGSSVTTHTRGCATIQLASIIDTTFGMAIDFHILDSITSPTPVAKIKDECWLHLRTLPLADPTFGTTGKIDALIGADIWGTIIQDGIVRGSLDEPFAQATRLGWVVFGPASVDTNVVAPIQSLHINGNEFDQRIEDLLRTFWEMDEPASPSVSSNGANLCEEIFLATHRRDKDGRYVVQIPFSTDAHALGNSHQLALRQFNQLERRLASDANLKMKYVAFMNEYIDLGHMRAIDDPVHDQSQAYFIPHHAVTEKFRVVFNASAKTTNGISLNDTQLIGPIIQDLLVNILLRFRRFAVAFLQTSRKCSDKYVSMSDINNGNKFFGVHQQAIPFARISSQQ